MPSLLPPQLFPKRFFSVSHSMSSPPALDAWIFVSQQDDVTARPTPLAACVKCQGKVWIEHTWLFRECTDRAHRDMGPVRIMPESQVPIKAPPPRPPPTVGGPMFVAPNEIPPRPLRAPPPHTSGAPSHAPRRVPTSDEPAVVKYSERQNLSIEDCYRDDKKWTAAGDQHRTSIEHRRRDKGKGTFLRAKPGIKITDNVVVYEHEAQEIHDDTSLALCNWEPRTTEDRDTQGLRKQWQ